MNYKIMPLIGTLMLVNAVSAATLVDLKNKPIAYLQTFITKQQSFAGNTSNLKTVRTDVDFNQTSHVRLQQTYAGIPIWNATAIVHNPAKAKEQATMLSNAPSMEGKIYEGIEKDLAKTPQYALSDLQKQKALDQAKALFAKKSKLANVSAQKESVKTIVYMDAKNVAHYAYLVSFYLDDGMTGAHRPTMILDASTLTPYRSWDGVLNSDFHASVDNIKNNFSQLTHSNKFKDVLQNKFGTAKFESDDDENQPPMEIDFIDVGGVGGNEKVGVKYYDGAADNFPTLKMMRIKLTGDMWGQKLQIPLCFLLNENAVIADATYRGLEAFPFTLCYKTEGEHNNAVWIALDKNGTRWKADEMNGGYSPSLDVLYGLSMARKLYDDWYGTPLYYDEETKEAKPFEVNVHYGRHYDNAFWNGESINFGDGGKRFYPLTALDVVVHEISHAFTDQRSGIDISHPQMAALHESFSDMAAMAAQYFISGKNTWDIGRDVIKGDGALRYIDDPKKDGVSIDHMKDYEEDMDCHHINGIFNKAFYLLSNTPGWDVRKAFDVMVKANMNYWNASMETFSEAACGVIAATKDYHYKVADVRVAFANVGIDTSNCQ